MRKLALTLVVALVVVLGAAWAAWHLLPGPAFAPLGPDLVDSAEPAATPDTAGGTPPRVAPPPESLPPPATSPPAGERADADVPPGRRMGPARPGRGPLADLRGAAVRYDLRADERRGGHTIERHVGLTDEQLRARLQRESISAASTYADLETAERVVGLTLRRHAARVDTWKAREGARPNLVLPFAAPNQPAVGRVLRRGAREPVDAHAAVVVLRWREGDAFVLTSYPEERGRRVGRGGQ